MDKKIKADLHVHSHFSDGSDNPQELIENLKNSGVTIFALTDHDTIDGCKEIEKHLLKDIKFIPSVELTCEYEDTRCHVLGLNCDINNNDLSELIKKGRILRKKKLETRIEFLKEKWDIILTQEEKDWLYSRNSVVKTHVANILVNRGLSDNNVDAMKKYLKGCKTPNSKFDCREAISAIVSAGGIPIWAHPLGGEGEIHINQETFIERFKQMKEYGIKGLECYYSRYNKDEIEFLTNFAKENDMLISGGSDYHGTNKDIDLYTLNVDKSYVEIDNLTVLKDIIK